MGLERLLEGFDAQPVYGYALFQNENKFSISYNQNDATDYHGIGLHNGRFLQKFVRMHLVMTASAKSTAPYQNLQKTNQA